MHAKGIATPLYSPIVCACGQPALRPAEDVRKGVSRKRGNAHAGLWRDEGAFRLSPPRRNVPGARMRTLAPTDQPKARQAQRRIVLTTFGSLGDLHPYIAVA